MKCVTRSGGPRNSLFYKAAVVGRGIVRRQPPRVRLLPATRPLPPRWRCVRQNAGSNGSPSAARTPALTMLPEARDQRGGVVECVWQRGAAQAVLPRRHRLRRRAAGARAWRRTAAVPPLPGGSGIAAAAVQDAAACLPPAGVCAAVVARPLPVQGCAAAIAASASAAAGRGSAAAISLHATAPQAAAVAQAAAAMAFCCAAIAFPAFEPASYGDEIAFSAYAVTSPPSALIAEGDKAAAEAHKAITLA